MENIREGESFLNYVDRFERDILGQLSYPMEEQFKCFLFWHGVPVLIRKYTHLIQDDYYHLRMKVIYAKELMNRQRQRKELKESERARTRAVR